VDGIGTNAEFYCPQGIALDNANNLFVADTLNHVIRKISSGAVVTTIAGLGESFGCADGTNNTARFFRPAGLAVSTANVIYVTDCFNHTIRKIAPAGTNWITTTISGWAGISGSADGTNNNARFFEPRGIVVDATGNLYVVDSGNHTIRQITPVGTNWVVTTIAGVNGFSGSADGAGSGARFNNPTGLAIDGAGYLYVIDSGNNTVRVDRVVPPQLKLSLGGGGTVLSWPSLSAGFILESAGTLTTPAPWTPLNGAMLSGDSYVLTNNVNPGNQFYRLRQP
jgi:sugar lactone lactonase YvrE